MRRSAYALVGALAAVAPLSATQAAAQGTDVRAFDVAAQPLRRALVAFAVQADMSIGAQDLAGCRPDGNAVRGRMTTDEGLRRLLANTGCSFTRIDARTVRIIRAPPPARISTPLPPIAPPPVTTVQDVVVTATRRSIGLSRAPYALSAVNGSDLAESAQPDLQGVAARVSGLTITNLGPGRNKIFVRGLSDGALSGRAQSMVGLYLDDMRLTYNAPDPDLRLADIERVELLRGPQGSLYGAGSIGGILQIVTRRPELDAYSGWFNAEAAASAGGGPSGVIEGGVNLPLVKDRLALRLVGYREVMGGYIDDAALGLDDVGETTRQGMRAALRFHYSPRWTASASFAAQTIHSDDTHYALDALAPRRRANLVREPHRNDFDALSMTIEGDLDWASLKASASLQNHGVDSSYDASLARPTFGAGSGPAAFLESIDNRASTSEVTLTSADTGRVSWLAGVFVSEYTSELATRLDLPSQALSQYQEDRRDHVDETAVFGELTWNISDRLKLTGGGRWFHLGVETGATVAEPSAALASRFDGRTRDRGFAPKVVASFEADDALLFYVQAAEGYRASGFNTSGRVDQGFSSADGPQPLRRFASDELWNYEAGGRAALFGNRLSLRAAVFRAEWRGIQADQILPSGLPFTANLGDGHNTGLEVEGRYENGPLRVEANVLVNDPELQSPAPGLAIPGDRGLPGVARFQFGSRVRYEAALNETVTGVVVAEAAYVGRSQLTFDAVTAPEMGDYWSTRLSVILASRRWKLSAWVDNLANSAGDTFAYGNPFSLRSGSQNTPQRPRTLGVGLSRAF